jgi:hypothetical protein
MLPAPTQRGRLRVRATRGGLAQGWHAATSTSAHLAHTPAIPMRRAQILPVLSRALATQAGLARAPRALR